MISQPSSSAPPADDGQWMFGHPTGLFTLFFAEMWERFSYYGMRALLVLYMIKGFLAYEDQKAYAVYGAYTALVYATPFIGGMIADRVLGARKAVVLGGLLMAAGHLTMALEHVAAFYVALALLIVGNGFFKPNISTIVGSLYPQGSPKKDGGFTIFYMGINLGAAMSPLICGYVGETYGWHFGFGLATIGMLLGLAVFVAPRGIATILVGGGAVLTAASMIALQLKQSLLLLLVNGFVGVALAAAGIVSAMAIARGGLPDWAGRPSDPEAPGRKVLGGLSAEMCVYGGAIAAVPILAAATWMTTAGTYLLNTIGAIALLYLAYEAMRGTRVERDRLGVVFIMMFFSMLFWAFFEQAGSSINLFTDRNVDRVSETATLTSVDVGKTIQVPVSQELVGRSNAEKVWTLSDVDAARATASETGTAAMVAWTVSEDDVGMGIAGDEVPASVFQATNPIFILVFGLVFTALWGFLGKKNLEPKVAVKFSMGLLQLGLGFGVLWWSASNADSRGMATMSLLVVGYLLHTTGELCLSPVGLSMVTKLSPKRLVSTVMGAWFLATAFSNLLAGFIAMLTGVGHGEGEEKSLPLPTETVGIYGGVFGKIAVASVAAAALLFVLAPLVRRLMHEEEPEGA